MQNLSFKKQQGFSILAIILVIVAVIVAIGVWALSGQTNTSNSSNSSADIQAAAIINDGNSIKLTFDTMVINGLDMGNIYYWPGQVDPNNMLDPASGMQIPKPNMNSIKANPDSTQGYWVYFPSTFYGSNLGSARSEDKAIMLAGIKDNVCASINKIVNGNSSIKTTTLTNPTDSATDSLPMPLGGNIIDMSAYPGFSGITSECVGTGTPDNNFYFRVLHID